MILSDRDISNEVLKGTIVIEPFRPECLGPNSYDVHLGPYMWRYAREVMPRAFEGYGYLDAAQENPTEDVPVFSHGHPKSWLLLPAVVYLASTEEYTETHAHVPYLDGKSSAGRLGISIHATAGRGDVGFCNHWTMEIVVAQPVRVYAGMPIGQLTYHVTQSLPSKHYGERATSKYQGRDPMPQASKMWKNFQK